MEGSSRAAWKTGLDTLHGVQFRGGDRRALAGDLFGVSELLSSESRLRRAFADPSRDAWPKRDLARRVLQGKISADALEVVESAVSGRWVKDQDLVDALERYGVDSVFAAAETEGTLPRLEDELFGVDHLAATEHELAGFLGRRDVPGEAKAQMLQRLLGGRVSGDALWLATRPVLNPRGRRYSAAIWRQLSLAADRRRQITAIVTSAVELTPDQKHRIEAALSRSYGRAVNANLVVDPSVLGGIHIRVGDDVIDGSIVRRLDDARRAMSTS